MYRKMLVALVAVFALAVTTLAVGDNILSAGRIRLLNGGALSWLQRVTSSGQVQFWDNVNSRVVFTIDDNSGAIGPRSQTTAQIAALTPPQAGLMVYNSSIKSLCVSTGTVIGAWAVAAATSTTMTVPMNCGG